MQLLVRLLAARSWLALLASVASSLLPMAASAQLSDNAVRIGILNDQSGLYADLAGPGSVEAARMAIEEFKGEVLGRKIELLSADHQNKADIGSSIARSWFDRDGVDVIADFSNSAVGLAVQALATEKHKVTLVMAASSSFTGKSCSPLSSQWIYNSYSNGYGLARILTEKGHDSWFLLTVDYAFGHAFAADIRKAVMEAGGKIAGEVRHPLNSTDMSSYLLQAQASKAKVIALASAGSDMTTAIQQAAEFAITSKQAMAAPIVFLNDVHSLGLQTAQGLQFLTAFYWDRDEASRAWSRRFFERRKAMPTMTQAGVYSAVRHYLKAVEAAGTDDGPAVAAKMRELPISDAYATRAYLREDGQVMHDMFLAEVKKPAESKGPWDYYKILATIPAEKVFQPLSASECPLVKK